MKIIKKIVTRISRMFGFKPFVPRMVKQVSGEFSVMDGNVKRRNYSNYDEYVMHQIEKADVYESAIRKHDAEYEKIIFDRFKNYELNGKSILCLGARFGGEVRAFTNHGALAIGIDLNPGENNYFVLPGDVHKIQFANGSFDIIYTNILDHIYDAKLFFSEIKRVLRQGGHIFFEINLEKPTRYEAIDISNLSSTIALLKDNFNVISRTEITNKTSYVNWRGELVECKN